MPPSYDGQLDWAQQLSVINKRKSSKMTDINLTWTQIKSSVRTSKGRAE